MCAENETPDRTSGGPSTATTIASKPAPKQIMRPCPAAAGRTPAACGLPLSRCRAAK